LTSFNSRIVLFWTGIDDECSSEIVPPGFSLVEDHVIGVVAFRLTSAIFLPSASSDTEQITFLNFVPRRVVALGVENENLLRYCFKGQKIWKVMNSPVLLLHWFWLTEQMGEKS
jgi:hypothetical protein